MLYRSASMLVETMIAQKMERRVQAHIRRSEIMSETHRDLAMDTGDAGWRQDRGGYLKITNSGKTPIASSARNPSTDHVEIYRCRFATV